MSQGNQHRNDPEIQREEHISADGQRDRKAVGLFAKDSLGDGTFELSAISTASGAVLSTTPASISGVNVDIGNVTLNPSPNQIGSVTIFGDINVTASSGNVTLNQGPNQIGSVTVSNFTAPNLGNVTLNQSPNFIGIVTVANPNAVSGNTTINPGPNQIGSVTVSNVINSIVTISPRTDYIGLVTATIVGTVNTGMLTIFPGPNYIGLVTATVGNTVGNATLNPSPNFIGLVTTVAGSNVTLNASSAHIGSVSIFGTVSSSGGAVTLYPGPAQIGSVTISNSPSVTQSGNWDIRSALSLASIYGEVKATNFVAPNTGNVTLNPSPSFIGIVTVANPGGVNTGNVTINPGPSQIGSITVSNVIGAIATISPRTDYIGLVSVSGNVAVSNFVSPNVGNVTLNASSAQVGSVTVSNQLDVRSLLSTATIFAVVNTGAVGNTNALATLLSGPNQIGSVTIANQPPLVAGTAQIGSVTVSNFVSPNIGNVTLNKSDAFIGIVTVANPGSSGMTTLFPGPNYIGLVTATVGNTVGNATLNPSPNQIGSVTISHVVNSITTITPRTDYIGLVTATIVGTVNTGMLTIFPGPNQIGSVTVSNFTAPNVGNVTLNASSAQIGSVTVSNIPAVTQSGNWDIRSALSLASIYGKVDLVNGLPTSTNWIGLATVTQGNQPALVAGTAQIGSVTVSNWVSPNVGNVTLNASNAFIGIVTIANPASSSGMVTIFGGPNQIGSVTVSNFVAPNVGNITLNASNAFIGIATVVPIISSTVVNFLVSVASGAKTQFPTNTVRQGIIQAYSENVSNVFIGNSAVTSGISDTRGMELQAGQAAGIEIDQTSKLYVALATGASGALSFFGSS